MVDRGLLLGLPSGVYCEVIFLVREQARALQLKASLAFLSRAFGQNWTRTLTSSTHSAPKQNPRSNFNRNEFCSKGI